MIPAAVLRNPTSARNARSGRRLDLPTAEPLDRAGLREALTRYRDDGIELLVVDGGDGTVREAMTALAELGWAPRLALLPAGKINLVANDVGAAAPGAVMRLVRGGWGTETIARRPLLRLERPGQSPVFGLFAGGAAFARACELANRHLHPRRIESRAAIAAALAVSLFRRPQATAMTVAVDDGAPVGGRHFLLLATTLERLVLGLWPFAGEGVGGLNYLDVPDPPRHLGRALLPLARGRPRPWMAEAGYRSGAALRLTVETSEPLVLDGEPFAPGPDGRMVLSSGPVVEFVRP